MSRFKTYQRYLNHGRFFNTFFLTSSLIIIAAIIAMFVYNHISSNMSIFGILIAIFATIIVIVFIASWYDRSSHIAYYKIWLDLLHGHFDSHKIFKTFTKTYRLKASKIRPKHLKADGRWNFHAETIYTKILQNERDHWLTMLYQECAYRIATIDEHLIEAQKAQDDNEYNLFLANRDVSEIKTRLAKSQSSAETYFQHQQLGISRANQKAKRHAIFNTECAIKELNRERDIVIDDFCKTADRIIEDYNKRDAKYSESATEIIDKVENLHYDIKTIPESPLNNFKKELTNAKIAIA